MVHSERAPVRVDSATIRDILLTVPPSLPAVRVASLAVRAGFIDGPRGACAGTRECKPRVVRGNHRYTSTLRWYGAAIRWSDSSLTLVQAVFILFQAVSALYRDVYTLKHAVSVLVRVTSALVRVDSPRCTARSVLQHAGLPCF